MTGPDPAPTEKDHADVPDDSGAADISSDTPDAPDPDKNEPSSSPGGDNPTPPGSRKGRSEDDEDKQTASVINNFYDQVNASTVGVSGGAGHSGKAAIRRKSGVLAAADVSYALRYYLRPAPFKQALKVLTEQRLVALVGPEGCGKKAGTLELARATCPEAESFTVLPPTRSLPELMSYRGYRAGQAFLLHDWVPVSTDSRSVASYDLEQLIACLRTADAYLAITFESADYLQALLGEMCVKWSAPEPGRLLDHCVGKQPDLQLSDSEREQLRSRAEQIPSPRLVVRLADSAGRSVAEALAEAGETENSAVAAWFASKPSRWEVWAVAGLTFLSGVRERQFERLLAALTEIKTISSTRPSSSNDDHRAKPADDEPFPQSRWALANDASLGTFISERDPAAPVGSEHRPMFRSKAYRLHFMMELNRRFGDELWSPVRDWTFALAGEPFGEAQIAVGYGLALLARCALAEVEGTYLTPWSAGDLTQRLMAVSVLWAMAEDDRVAGAALRIAVSWVRNRGQERAITAAIALGGPLGQLHPSEAMRWLWVLALRGERVGRVARTAMGQLFAMEAEAELEKSTVVRFLVQKIRRVLKPDVTAPERRAALAVANAVLGAMQTFSEVPIVVSVLRARPADFRPIGELWAAVLNSVPHRREAIWVLHLTLAALTEGDDSEELAARLGAVILPRLKDRTLDVLERVLPDPQRAEQISASVVAAFLGAQRQTIGASR